MKKTVLLLPLFALVACSQTPVEPKEPEPTPSVSSSPTPTIKPSPTVDPIVNTDPVRLAFTGDMHFEGEIAERLDNPPLLASEFPEILRTADYTMGNLETALTDKGKPTEKELEDPSSRFHFRTDQRALKMLENAGYDVLTQANNHAADYGPQGFKQGLQWRNETPLSIVGVGESATEAYAPHLAEIKGSKFAFFGVDASKLESNNSVWRATDSNAGVAALRTKEEVAKLTAEIEKAKSDGAFVVVYVHWGTEGESCVDSNQTKLSKTLSKAGTGLIVGSHAHRLQGNGWLNQNTYVAYGLGNFLWYHGRVASTGVLDVTVKNGLVQKARIVPMSLPLEGGVPQLAKGVNAKNVKNDLTVAFNCSGLTKKRPSATEFNSTVEKVSKKELGTSWKDGCPVPAKQLRAVTLNYHGFDGEIHKGKIIVNGEITKQVRAAFKTMFDNEFPLKSVKPITAYKSDDDKSMAANNSSGFNCRVVHGTSGYSKHAYGLAFDVNPLQNPYVTKGGVLPPNGAEFVKDRDSATKGLLTAEHPVVKELEEQGWTWGGRWANEPDYQHFVWDKHGRELYWG